MATITPNNLNVAENLDHTLQSALGKITGGMSPLTLSLAFIDWGLHLAIHPAKQFELLSLAQQNYWFLLHQYAAHTLGDSTGEFCCITTSTDKRFVHPEWQKFPYSFLYESFLLMQNWWHIATTDVRGVNKHHQDIVDFTIRQYLDMISPSNFPLTNPEVQSATLKQEGVNFIKGFEHYLEDLKRQLLNEPPVGSEQYVIGKNVAVTDGEVIYKNNLIELIKYNATTNEVYAEPVLITPAWIMKYYILDLTPKHSLVKYLVDKGHTVYMISWKNPQAEDASLTMENYLHSGILSSLDVINKIQPNEKVHLMGYCLGGTLAAIAAAKMARDDDNRLASLTLLAAQTDFSEPGELGLFIDESQIAFLESLMMNNGYLDTHQMAGAFQLLRSNDLIWSRIVREYMLGERKPLTDLMAWNADATRLPFRMHSEYLRNLFLKNELAEAKYNIGGKPIALSDIKIPIFIVATERDHVSPWRSVFKINLLVKSDVTFALTSGGHNVGIVSLPSKTTKRYYRIDTMRKKDRYVEADVWYQNTKPKSGSWWPAWEKWLSAQSGKEIIPPRIDKTMILGKAPGTYVLQK